MRRARRIGTAAAVTIAVAELVGHLLARRIPPLDPTRRTAVIVLGYRSRRDGSSHFVQRWRIRMAARTLAEVDDGWLILSGGATRGHGASEAEVMAAFARDVLRVPADQVELEAAARSTWENIHLAVPLAIAGGAEQIVVVSDPFHITRALRYIPRQFPALGIPVAGPGSERPLAYAWLKPVLLADLSVRGARDLVVHRGARRHG